MNYLQVVQLFRRTSPGQFSIGVNTMASVEVVQLTLNQQLIQKLCVYQDVSATTPIRKK
jgi:hypothetical protein